MKTGEKVLRMRKARGWSQEELAEKIGVTRQAVSRWESETAKPDADKIIAICDLFGVTADYLLRDGDGTISGENRDTDRKTTALGEAIRKLSLAESGCLLISLFGLFVVLIIGILGSIYSLGGIFIEWIWLISVGCLFIWPIYRILKLACGVDSENLSEK